MTANAIRSRRARPRESVRPIDRSGPSVRADDERSPELRQALVDGQLPDRRLLAEAVQVGQELLLPDEERVALATQPIDVVAGRRDADGLGEREERQEKDQDDPAEDDRQ